MTDIELDPHPEPQPPPHNPYQSPGSWNLEPPAWEPPSSLGELRPVPWEDLEAQPGWWERLVEQMRLSFTNPMQMAERIPQTEGIWAPYRLLLITSVPGILLTVLGIAIFGSTAAFSRMPGSNPYAALGGMGLGMGIICVLVIVLYPLMLLLGMLLGGAINHLFLWIFGGTSQGVGLEQTIRTTAYASAVTQLVRIPAAIPFIGGCFGLLLLPLVIIILVYQGMALAKVHRTDTWRGVCAVFGILVLGCCCAGIAIAVIAAAASGRFH